MISDFAQWFDTEVEAGRLSPQDETVAESAWDESRSALGSGELLKLDSVLLDFLIDAGARCEKAANLWVVVKTTDGTTEALTPPNSGFQTSRDAIRAAVKYQGSLGRF
jgi:hypothetical protein